MKGFHIWQKQHGCWENTFFPSYGVRKSRQGNSLYCSKKTTGNIKQKRTQISVFIFYSHMLHFALNVQVILSGQTQKVWVSTYSNVLYSLSSFIQENTRELSVTIYTHYSLAIWLRSFTKWGLQNKEERRDSVNRKAACMNLRGVFFKCWLVP